MRKMFALMVLAPAALAAAAPAASVRASQHAPGSMASMLALRLRSIELQIDILSDRDLIGHDEAQGLRREARRLEQRIYRVSGREAGDIDLAVGRLQEQLRLAAADRSLGADFSPRRDLGRFDDGDRYQRESDSYYNGDSYPRPDPRGDPFLKWEERDAREPH